MNFVKKVLDYLRILLSVKTIKLLVIPILLFFLWISLSLTFSSYKSFTVLQYYHEIQSNNILKQSKLLKEQKITEKFRAKENNLGIIAIRIGEVPIVDYEKEDKIVFRIKESGKDDWMFENNYRTSSFTSNQLFPFGFPIIENSKDNIYEYEIVSLRGVANNSIEIKANNSNYVSKYKFSKNEIFSGVDSFIIFMKKKMITFISNQEVLISSFGFLLPFIFYTVWVVFPYEKLIKKLSNNKNLLWLFLPLNRSLKRLDSASNKDVLVALVALLIISDIFLYDFFVPVYTLGLLILWMLFVYIARIKIEVTFIFSFSLVIVSIISIYIDLNLNVDKISSYAYFLLVLGFIQTLVEYRKSIKK